MFSPLSSIKISLISLTFHLEFAAPNEEGQDKQFWNRGLTLGIKPLTLETQGSIPNLTYCHLSIAQ